MSLDLFSPVVQQHPFDLYAPLRDDAPVALVGDPPTLAIVSRHRDVVAVLRDHERFSSEILPVPVMMFRDPPDHTRIRATVARAFTPRAIEGLEPRVREIATALVEPYAIAGGGDFVDAVASRLPVYVIGEVLGVPTDDREQLRVWSDQTIRSLSVSAGAEGDDADAAVQGALALAAYLDEVVQATPPSGTIASQLVAFERSGELDHTELVAFLQFMFVAGHETTMALLSHGAELLSRDPALLARLRGDRSLVSAFVEEVLRAWSPLQRLFRKTTCDVTIDSVEIPEGTTVCVLLGAANRDERRFPAGDDVDLADPVGGHVAFGHGIHHCLGAALARLEGRVGFEVLLEHVDRLEIDPDRPPTRFSGGTTSELQSTTLHLLVGAAR